MIQDTEVLDTINKKIKEMEMELKKLTEAKSIILGKSAPVSITTEKAKSQKRLPFKNPRGRSEYSIGALSVRIIREAGKPLHVTDIVPKLLAQGRHTDKSAVSIALHRLYKDGGILKKTYPNTFDLINNEEEINE